MMPMALVMTGLRRFSIFFLSSALLSSESPHLSIAASSLAEAMHFTASAGQPSSLHEAAMALAISSTIGASFEAFSLGSSLPICSDINLATLVPIAPQSPPPAAAAGVAPVEPPPSPPLQAALTNKAETNIAKRIEFFILFPFERRNTRLDASRCQGKAER